MQIRLLAFCIIASTSSIFAQNSYSVRNLVSDIPGAAEQTDPNLKNPWGLSTSSSSPFWISNNHTGTTTLYNTDGLLFPTASPLVVKIPAPVLGGSDAVSAPTGQAFNDTGGFEIQTGKPAQFLFVTEDGTIAAWSSAVDLARAQIMVDNSSTGAVYKGMTIARTSNGPVLYAANFRSGMIEAYDTQFRPLTLPDELRGPLKPGYGPFNIQRIGQRLYVTYAVQSDAGPDDVAGPGNGAVRIFTLDGHASGPAIDGGALNSPWGLALAPEYFGSFSQSLLVGNFGDGVINAYDSCSGQFLGALSDPNGKPIVTLGLWGLRAGNGHTGGEAGVLYFTAGIPGGDSLEDHGLFGALRPAPPAPPAPAPTPAAVDIRNFAFSPDPINISVGGTVQWINNDQAAHTVVGDAAPFKSGTLSNKAMFSAKFDTPGTYDYHCSIHPFMKAKVVVK